MNTLAINCDLKTGSFIIKKKKSGHYCQACGETRPNEKFSGKGYRQHICKDCKKKGEKPFAQSTSIYDREVNYLNKAIRNCLILYLQRSNFFLFEYRRARYITRDDFESEIFLYQSNDDQTFKVDESLERNEALLEVLYKKYFESMENGHAVDDDVLEQDLLDLSKKRQQHIEVILALKQLVYEGCFRRDDDSYI